MKKLYLIFGFILILLLTSCSIGGAESAQIVEAPENNQPPISGKWTVTKTIDGPYKRGEINIEDDISNIEALFSKEAVIIGKNFTLEPSYKTRRIDVNEYLYYNYKIDTEYLDIPEQYVDILTVNGEDGYFDEFIKYDKDKMILFSDEKFIFFEKDIDTVSSEEVKRYIDVENSLDIGVNGDPSYTVNTGLLLGLKSSYMNEESGLNGWNYRTIWIRTSNRELSSIYEIENLLLPRKKGFWSIDVERQENNENTRDVIIPQQLGRFEDESSSKDITPLEKFFTKNARGEYLSQLKQILYIGNDYLSVEEINPATNRKNLRMYPLDYLEEDNPTMISSLIDADAFYGSAKSNLKLEEESKLEEKSFGIERKNGHWILKGRLNYSDENEEQYKDFNIKAIPPKEVVQYDELILSWSLIKSRFPKVIDAFVSPNEDLILIVTAEELRIYPISDGDILQEKLGTIKLEENEKIVMSEWGLGKYTNLWEKEVLKNNVINLKE